MNYQQAIADATKQIRCRSAAAAAVTTAEITGSGFFSCFPAVVVTADIATTTADAANVLIPEGPSIRALSHCNNGY